MRLALDMNKVHFFDPETEQRLIIDANDEIEEEKPVKKTTKKVEEKVEA